MRLQYENTEINAVRVLRRDPESVRYWICKCPLCHVEFRARTDSITNGTVKNCGKHSKAHHMRIAREAERARVRQGLKTEPSTPADDAQYGVAAELDSKGRPIISRSDLLARRRAAREAKFTKYVVPDTMLKPLERLPDQNGHQLWMFECACGTKMKALRGNVVSGRTRSCGCIPRGRPKQAKTTQSPKAFLDLWK